MHYSFKELARLAGLPIEDFVQAEREFNHVVNPKLRLSNEALLFLMGDVITDRPDAGLEVLFEDSEGEPIIPPHPSRVNNWFKRLADRMVDSVLAVPADTPHRSGKKLAKLSELEAALAFLKEHGDMPLRQCLSEEEITSLPRGQISSDEEYNTILMLDDKVPGLVLSKESDEAIGRPRLTPKGRAVDWIIVDSERPDHVEVQLDRLVTDHYGLPTTDTYEFLAWKYLTEIRGFLFPPGNFWSDNERVLRDLGLSPLNADTQYGGCDWTNYMKLRNELIGWGVSTASLQEVEEKFISHLGEDFLSKNEAVMQWPAFVLGRIFKADNVLLYDHLEQEAKRLLRRATDCFLPKNSPVEPIALDQAARQLKRTVDSDLLMFMVFYSHIFVPKKLPEIRGGISQRPIRPRGAGHPKPGRKLTPGKAAIVPIRRQVVELLKDHGVEHAYDKAAEILNALALRQVYSMAGTGEHRVSSSDTLVYKEIPGKTGFRTKGGRVLRNELHRERL